MNFTLKSLAVFIGLLVTAAVFGQGVKPLSVAEIEELLKNGVTQKRVAELIGKGGVTFEATSSVKQRLKNAGAENEVLQAAEKAGAEYARKQAGNTKKASPDAKTRNQSPAGDNKSDAAQAKLEAENKTLREKLQKLEDTTKSKAGDLGKTPAAPSASSGRSTDVSGSIESPGTISGVVKFMGVAPASRTLEVNKDREICAASPKTDPSFIVSGGNLANAVVYIIDVSGGKRMEPRTVTLDQSGCEFKPHVLGFPAGSTVEILNSDGILHNVHGFGGMNSLFNMAQPKFKKTLGIKIDRPEIIQLKCDVHGWMNAWLFVAENPYFSITDNSGSFRLTDVPPGTYNLEVWHETLGKVAKRVTVTANQGARINFEYTR